MMKEAKKILYGIAKKYEIEKKASEIKVLEIWNDFIAIKFPVKTCATSFKGGILHITVEKPTWTQELTVLKALLVEELNKICKAEKVKDVRLHTGNIKVHENIKISEVHDIMYDSDEIKVNLETQEIERIANQSFEIQNDELRIKFATLQAKDMKFRKELEKNDKHKCFICKEYEVLENEMCSKCFRLCDEEAVIDVVSILKEDVTLDDSQIKERNPQISLKEIRVARLLVSNLKKEMLMSYLKYGEELNLEETEFIWRLSEEYVWVRFSAPLKTMDDEMLNQCLGENVISILNATKIS